MTESAIHQTPAATPSKALSKKKAPKTKGASKKAAPSHPPTAQMVNNAIRTLKERGGSSLQAIKKYIASTYKVDVEKLSPFIKKYLKGAADGGKLIRTKGKGASGSFKLADAKKSSVKKAAAKPKSKSAKPKKPKVKKSPKKVKVTKPKASKPKAAGPKKASKVKKAAKSPAAKKLKTPKPKKVVVKFKKVVAKK